MNRTLDSLPLGRGGVFSDVCNNRILLGRVERKFEMALREEVLMWILGNQGVHCNESVGLWHFLGSPAHSHGGTVSLSASPSLGHRPMNEAKAV